MRSLTLPLGRTPRPTPAPVDATDVPESVPVVQEASVEGVDV